MIAALSGFSTASVQAQGVMYRVIKRLKPGEKLSKQNARALHGALSAISCSLETALQVPYEDGDFFVLRSVSSVLM
jgi:hypothetical protein